MNIKFAESQVAYFSMEVGIEQDIPTYSGGLGILAGDTLRSCADLDVPVVGVTLLYHKGYFRQKLDEHGQQREEEMQWDPAKRLHQLPNEVSVLIGGREVRVRAWLYAIKGTFRTNPLLFLDTRIEGNSEEDKILTDHLYGRDDAYRLSQEIVLGVGGVRMLESLGCTKLRKYHMNEGHAALLALELYARHHHKLEEVRERCVFTTHTPVPAGHDQFPGDLAHRLVGDLLPKDRDVFHDGKLNMTWLGLQFSTYINGVAKKHGEVSRTMFPGYEIESITNGVHATYWASEPMAKLFDNYLHGWHVDPFSLRYALSVPKDDIWAAHAEGKRQLFAILHDLGLKEDVFTIGFARRATAYKRAELLLTDLDRLKKIAEKFGGLQIIYAGKAHPRDQNGKDIIRGIIQKMRACGPLLRFVYLENYDISIAKFLIPGVDLWLNTPLRPHEASGTSGMKAAINGVPQLSTLDGWWLEGHIEDVTGWSIGQKDAPQERYEDEVADLYNKLEYVIMPKYKERDEWVEVMRHAIAINGSFFNTHRMVQQYVLNAYFT